MNVLSRRGRVSPVFIGIDIEIAIEIGFQFFFRYSPTEFLFQRRKFCGSKIDSKPKADPDYDLDFDLDFVSNPGRQRLLNYML